MVISSSTIFILLSLLPLMMLKGVIFYVQSIMCSSIENLDYTVLVNENEVHCGERICVSNWGFEVPYESINR